MDSDNDLFSEGLLTNRKVSVLRLVIEFDLVRETVSLVDFAFSAEATDRLKDSSGCGSWALGSSLLQGVGGFASTEALESGESSMEGTIK